GLINLMIGQMHLAAGSGHENSEHRAKVRVAEVVHSDTSVRTARAWRGCRGRTATTHSFDRAARRKSSPVARTGAVGADTLLSPGVTGRHVTPCPVRIQALARISVDARPGHW